MVEVTSRIATRDRAIDFSQPGPVKALDRASFRLYTGATELLPTDGIVRRTASEITHGAPNDLDKARAIYEWVVDHTARNPKTRGCGVGDIRSMPVYGAVAQCVDHPRRAEHRLAGGILETRVVDQRRQVVLVRQLQRRIVLLGPAHREFERAPCLEARRAWIGVHGRLGPHSGFEHRRPLALQESELAHAGASSSAASSSTYLR